MKRNTRFRQVDHPRGKDGRFVPHGADAYALSFSTENVKDVRYNTTRYGLYRTARHVAQGATAGMDASSFAGPVGTGPGALIGATVGLAGGAAQMVSDRVRLERQLKRERTRSNSAAALRR